MIQQHPLTRNVVLIPQEVTVEPMHSNPTARHLVWANRPSRIRSMQWAIMGVTFLIVILTAIELSFAVQEPKTATEKSAAEKSETSSATEQADEALKEKAQALLRQLDADEKKDRDAAERGLIKLGPGVLQYLQSAGGEVGLRINRVRNELEKEAIAKNTRATMVNLVGEMTVAEAFKKITEQTGNQFANVAQNEKKVTLDIKDMPFWQATDQLLDQSELTVNSLFIGQAGSLSVAQANGAVKRTGMADYSGIFRIEPTRISTTREMRSPETSRCRISIEVGWEPRLRPITIALPIEKVSAIDDLGKEIATNYSGRAISASVQSEIPVVQLNVPFEIPNRSAKKIAKLTGELNVVVPGRMEVFEFTQLTKPGRKKIKKANVEVSCDGFKKNLDLYGLRIRVRFDDKGSNAMESYQDWIYSNEALLVDEAGNTVENIGRRLFLQSENEAGFEYLFDLTKKPSAYKLKYKSPTGIVTKNIKFEIKEIDLP